MSNHLHKVEFDPSQQKIPSLEYVLTRFGDIRDKIGHVAVMMCDGTDKQSHPLDMQNPKLINPEDLQILHESYKELEYLYSQINQHVIGQTEVSQPEYRSA